MATRVPAAAAALLLLVAAASAPAQGVARDAAAARARLARLPAAEVVVDETWLRGTVGALEAERAGSGGGPGALADLAERSGRWLDRAVPQVGRPAPPDWLTTLFGSGLQLLAFLLTATGLLALAALARAALGALGLGAPAADGAAPGAPAPAEPGGRDWAALARDAEARGLRGLALHCHLQRLLDALDRAGAAGRDPALTTEELCRAVAARPELAGAAREVGQAHDRLLFGGAEPDAPTLDRCRAAVERAARAADGGGPA